jgi:inosose dehydratase
MLRIANAPVSWGVSVPSRPEDPSWSQVLDEIAEAGYRWMELGPITFWPADLERVRRELAARDVAVIGTFIYEHLHRPDARRAVVAAARRTAKTVASLGARFLVIIDAMSPARMASAGRSTAARRLDDAAWSNMVSTVEEAAHLAREHGLTPVFHQHVGSYVEFEDELERLIAATDPKLVRLCIDTGHVAYAGMDVVELYRRHRERIAYFHLKDVRAEVRQRVEDEGLGWDEGVRAGIFCPLGKGCVDLVGLRDELARHGFEGWATVEQDIDPGGDEDPLSAARASLAYLREIGLAGS